MRSVRAYLLTLAAGLILVSTIAFAVLVGDAARTSRSQTEAQLRETAKVLSIAVDGELQGALGVLFALAESRAAQSREWAVLDRQARAAIRTRNAWLVVQDRSGRQLVNTGLPPGAELPSGAPPQPMWRELESGEPRICNLSSGIVEDQIVCVDVPIREGGEAAFALSMVFRPAFFDSIVSREQVEQGHIAALIDRSGRLIWRNIHPEKFVGTAATPDVRQAVRTSAEGSLESTNLDGVRTLAAFDRSELSGWTVIVGTPLEATLAASRKAQWRGSFVALGMLVLGCLLALYVGRRVSGAVRQVGESARSGGFGVGRELEPTGFVELDELQSALRDAAAAQSESEQRFREVADAAPVLIWVADPQNLGVWYNKAWLDFTGRTMEQELGHGWLESVHPEDRDRAAEICGGAFDRREPFRIEFRMRRADGQWRILDDRGVPRFADDGEFLGYVGSCVDVTDPRRSEIAIRESEERFRRIFEQASDLIITADLQQVITDCNPSAAAAVGLSRQEAIGRRISDFISQEDFDRTTQMLRQKIEQGGTTRYDVRVRSAAGDWLFWEINSGLTYDEEGRPVGLHVVGRDVTERKRWENHQRMLVGELNHRVKNTLAIVQSLSHQTFRAGSSPRESIAAFEARLEALAGAHNLLTSENWASASMRDVIRQALAPFCGEERCAITGPDLRIHPKTAVTLALATHELATNASKYGSLSVDGGRVVIEWAAEDDRLDFSWREEGGPPVEEPSATGFGTRMIKRGLAADLGGEVELRFERSGVLCRIRAPLPVIEEV